jgi:Ca-activated chloride channel family protein
MMHFESPWAFLLLALIPLLLVLRRQRVHFGSIRFSSTGNAVKAGRSLRQRFSVLPLILRVLALVFLTVALARPQAGREQIRETTSGIAIEVVVDRSGSMAAEMAYKGRQMNRLDVVKAVFTEFAMGNGRDLAGRPNDLIGMITFARYPDTTCPLTLAHGALPLFLDGIEIVQRREEDGTAIGDALALAAARLKTAEETLHRQRGKNTKAYRIKSKIIILLSDGENNAGRRDPIAAAELAEKWGIKIYTIAIGGGEAVTTISTPFGVYKVPIGKSVDTSTLRTVAEKTGGIFRTADNAKALHAVYEEIDKLEKSEIESVRFVDYKESFARFALAGLLLTGCEVILNCTLFRKIP